MAQKRTFMSCCARRGGPCASDGHQLIEGGELSPAAGDVPEARGEWWQHPVFHGREPAEEAARGPQRWACCCYLLLGLLLLAVACCCAVLWLCSGLDDQWAYWLETPPVRAVKLASHLAKRADRIVALLPRDGLAVRGEADVVVSAGGNLDAYFLGVWMVLSRVQWSIAAGDFQMVRYQGASSGGQIAYELMLKGENATLVNHLTYGIIVETYPKAFCTELLGRFVQDHSWAVMSRWQAAKWNPKIPSLNGKVSLATTCFSPLPHARIIDAFTDVPQAASAFSAAGAGLQLYNGSQLCTDGALLSPSEWTPLFQDGRRQQIVVDLSKALHPGYHERFFLEDVPQIEELVQRGQEDAALFLRQGSLSSGAIALCAKGADVSGSVCRS